MPVLEINGSYMEPNYNDGEIVVSIKTKKDNKGKIEIEYYSPEELDRILELLM